MPLFGAPLPHHDTPLGATEMFGLGLPERGATFEHCVDRGFKRSEYNAVAQPRAQVARLGPPRPPSGECNPESLPDLGQLVGKQMG